MSVRSVRILVVLLALPALHALHAQETSVTIYADGRVNVRRTVAAAVPAGASTLRFDLGVRDADAGSFVALDSGVEVRAVRHNPALGLEGTLRRLVGREIKFRQGVDAVPYVMGTLLSADPIAVRVFGEVLYSFPGTPVFPDSLVQLEPWVELTLESSRAQPALRVMYASGGLSWNASYALLLPRGAAGTARMSGTATINNGAGLSLRDVEVQLLAGNVSRAGPRPPMPRMAVERAMANQAADFASEEALSGTHLYTLPGRHTFVPGETRGLALFPQATAPVEREYTLSNSYGIMNQWPDQMRDQHPEIAWRVRRPANAPAGSLAAVPLPGGVVRLYEPDAAGRPQLAGEASIDHTPAGRDLRLVAGTAFDITATRVQAAFERNGEREATSSYRVELQNARTEAVSVLVTDQCHQQCEVLSSSVPAERGSASMIGFRVNVPANGSAVLEYRLRARW